MQNAQEIDGVKSSGQWSLVARIWQQLGSPLRPVEDDLVFFRSALDAWCGESSGLPPRVLILGVTPELYHLPWPINTSLKAVDRTIEMIKNIWPGSQAQVMRSDWLTMEWPDASFDMVLCDGGLHLLDYPQGQQQLANKLAHIIAPGGKLVFRLFVPPVERESPQEVIEQLFYGAIPNLNCLKLRLGMALQECPEQGIALSNVWSCLHEAAGNWPDLAANLGWSIEHLSVIDAYRDSAASYHFVSMGQVENLFCRDLHGCFELEAVSIPAYVMGEQCPTMVLHRTFIKQAI